MLKRLLLTESVKKAIKDEFNVDLETIDEDMLLQKLRSSKKFVVSLRENGTFKVRQVLKG